MDFLCFSPVARTYSRCMYTLRTIISMFLLLSLSLSFSFIFLLSLPCPHSHLRLFIMPISPFPLHHSCQESRLQMLEIMIIQKAFPTQPSSLPSAHPSPPRHLPPVTSGGAALQSYGALTRILPRAACGGRGNENAADGLPFAKTDFKKPIP